MLEKRQQVGGGGGQRCELDAIEAEFRCLRLTRFFRWIGTRCALSDWHEVRIAISGVDWVDVLCAFVCTSAVRVIRLYSLDFIYNRIL